MDISVASRTDVGRVRANNEDSFKVDEALGLYMVCDGMGGHNAGEVASAMCCEVVEREIVGLEAVRQRFLESGNASDAKTIRKGLENAVGAACKEVFRQASRNPDQAGMGTTCTVVLLIGHNKGILAHVGDSRLFVLRQKQVRVLSEDHTYVNELVRRGAITREQAKNHPQGNVLSRALGVQPSVAVDTMIFDMDAGDTYLLCSDGLYNYFPDPQDLHTELAGPDLALGIDRLVDQALESGGHDNCTGIIFRVGGQIPESDNTTAAEQRIAILKKIPIFTHLTYNELVKVLGLTQLTRMAEGEHLTTEGDVGEELFVILAGEVEVIKGGELFATLKPGSHLGEMAMVDNAPRSATVRALMDVNVLTMRRSEFFGLIRSEPVIATKLLWSFVKVLSGRLRDTNEALQGAMRTQASEEEFQLFVQEDS